MEPFYPGHTTKRSRLDEKISSGIIFVRENMRLLCKDYNKLTKDDKNALPLALTGIPVDDEHDVDVGHDLFKKTQNIPIN